MSTVDWGTLSPVVALAALGKGVQQLGAGHKSAGRSVGAGVAVGGKAFGKSAGKWLALGFVVGMVINDAFPVLATQGC
jgi:hypothetical protein